MPNNGARKTQADAEQVSAVLQRSVGRPTDYRTEIAEQICMRMMEGEGVVRICRDENMPCKSTVYRWLIHHKEFADMYARTIPIRADLYFEETLDIADNATNDWMEKFNSEGESQGWALNGEHVQRSRLRVDTRKWAAARLNPRKYGDKVEHTGEGGGAIKFVVEGGPRLINHAAATDVEE